MNIPLFVPTVRLAAGTLCWAAIVLARPARAVDSPATSVAEPPPSAAPQYPLTGDWFGARTTLADHGITAGGNILLDASRNLAGGIRQDESFRYLLDINATLDTRQAFNFHGGTLFIDFQNHEGPNATDDLAGDAQGFDNQDAPHFTQIYQLWYQQLFAGDTLRLKLGKIDANNDFSHIEPFTNARSPRGSI